MTTAKQQLSTESLPAVIGRTGIALRQIGMMVAELETSLIDAGFETDGRAIDRSSMQQIDLVLQSVEELACLLERLEAQLQPGTTVSHELILAPVRLEWLRHLLADVNDGQCTQNRSISLF